MASLIRRVSTRISERRDRQHRFTLERKKEGLKSNEILCTVVTPDENESKFHQDKKDKAVELYNKVYANLDLQDERDYFALKYLDKHNVGRWLDPTKSIVSQCKNGPPFHFRLQVRFYSSEPSRLSDELARYFFVCQLKEDIREGRLDCDYDVAVELAALVLQSDVGDYRDDEHDLEFVSSYRFLPEERQTEDFEEAVLEQFATLKSRKMNPATADKIYLDKVKTLPEYGIDKHVVVGKDGNTYVLGIIGNGVLLYQDKEKIGMFTWENMPALEFNGKKLRIVAVDRQEGQETTQHEFILQLPTKSACKHLWRCCMEHHCFFRLREAPKPPSGLRKYVFRASSRFTASIRNTQYSILKQQQSKIGTGVSGQRATTRVQRRPTRRFSARDSFRADASLRQDPSQFHARSNTMPLSTNRNSTPAQGTAFTRTDMNQSQGVNVAMPRVTLTADINVTPSKANPSGQVTNPVSDGIPPFQPNRYPHNKNLSVNAPAPLPPSPLYDDPTASLFTNSITQETSRSRYGPIDSLKKETDETAHRPVRRNVNTPRQPYSSYSPPTQQMQQIPFFPSGSTNGSINTNYGTDI